MRRGSGGLGAIIIAAGPLGSALFSIVLTFIISWNFVPEIVGLLAILELVALFFVMVFTLGLDQAYVREHAGADDTLMLFAAAIVVPILLATASAMTAAIVLSTLHVAILPNIGWTGTAIALFYGVSSLVIRMLSTSLRMSAAPQLFAVLQVVQRGVALVCLVSTLSITTTRSPLIVLTCYMTGAFASVVLHLVACRREVGAALANRFPVPLFKSLLAFGLPAAVSAFLYALLSSSDRIAMAFFGTARDLGIYAVALSIAGSVTIFTSIFAIVWAPFIYGNETRARNAEVIRPYLDIATLLTFLAGGAIATIAWFFPYIFPKDYSGVAYLVPACMALPLLYILAETFGIGIGVSRRMGYATLASGISAAVAFSVSFLLVPGLGAKGAAAGILAGSLCFLVVRTEISAILWYRLPSLRMYALAIVYGIGAAVSLSSGAGLGVFFPLYWAAFCIGCLIVFQHRLAGCLALMKRTLLRRN
jgi:O-antigen/teichoic acid export membrane protein